MDMEYGAVGIDSRELTIDDKQAMIDDMLSDKTPLKATLNVKNYRDQTPQKRCMGCLHSFDDEYYEGTDLYCLVDFECSAETMHRSQYVFYSPEYINSKEYDSMRMTLFDNEHLNVSVNGVCDSYELKERE